MAPRAHQADEEGVVPAEVRKALAAADLLRITVGEQWGGMGLGDVEASIVLEEIARADVSAAICCQLTFNGPPRGIEHLGPEAMKERWLPAAADGDAIISIGITEPDAGSAVQNMRASLVEDGPGRWRLNAYKNYSTLGDVAQGVLVWCRWPGGEGAKGIGAVIVPTDREGVSVTGRHKGMGIHAATEAELAFDGVAITEDDVLIAGDPSSTDAFKVLLSHLNHERCGNASMCVGAAQGALEHAVRYMNERVIGGRPLADLQGLQWKLADMAVQLEGARLLLARAVRLAGPGRHAAAARDGAWPRRRPTWPPSSCATRPCRSTAATATRASTRSSGPTATSGACASGPGRSRRSATTSGCGWRRAPGRRLARVEGPAGLIAGAVPRRRSTRGTVSFAYDDAGVRPASDPQRGSRWGTGGVRHAARVGAAARLALWVGHWPRSWSRWRRPDRRRRALGVDAGEQRADGARRREGSPRATSSTGIRTRRSTSCRCPRARRASSSRPGT